MWIKRKIKELGSTALARRREDFICGTTSFLKLVFAGFYSFFEQTSVFLWEGENTSFSQLITPIFSVLF